VVAAKWPMAREVLLRQLTTGPLLTLRASGKINSD